jgi:hypothetical protein
VSRPDGSTERHRIEGEQVTIGRSPTAGIPLVNCDDLQPEHLLVAPRPDGCWVAVAKGATPPVLVAGRPISGEIVRWGTEINVGTTTITLSDKLVDKKAKDGKQVGSPIMILMFVAVPLAGWLLLAGPDGDLPDAPGGPPPPLFDEITACPDRGAAGLHRAQESAEAASHRSERYPFDAQDGVQAVQLYATASACYQAAGRASDATRLRREHDVLARRLEEDYRTHRLRLERALEFQHFEDALVEAKELNSLLRHRQGDPYAQWLELLERRLQLIVDQTIAARG